MSYIKQILIYPQIVYVYLVKKIEKRKGIIFTNPKDDPEKFQVGFAALMSNSDGQTIQLCYIDEKGQTIFPENDEKFLFYSFGAEATKQKIETQFKKWIKEKNAQDLALVP